MAESHWNGFASFLETCIESAGFDDFWDKESESFPADYTAWINKRLPSKHS